MKNDVYGKTIKNVRNRIDVKFVSNEKGYLKWALKSSCMPQIIFDNDLVTMCKAKLLMLGCVY